MQIKRMDVTIGTHKLKQSKEFYIKYFGFELVYESDWYVELISGKNPAAGISFVLPQHEAGEKFNGQGIIVSFEVDDVDAEFARVKAAGIHISEGLHDKPWGERAFVVNDPNGVHLYVYKLIPATPEYQKIYDSFRNR